jgi:hypothetical protein
MNGGQKGQRLGGEVCVGPEKAASLADLANW